MALTSEELAELSELLKRPDAGIDDSYRTWAQQQVDAFEDQRLKGWAGAGGTKADSAEPVPGALGLKGIIGQEGAGAVPEAEAQAEQLAAQLDPRFSLVPQVLALQPATTDPEGDQAAQQKWQAGQKSATFVYEPPVAVVRKQLLENPALVRALHPDDPPPLEEITALDSSSELYKSAADYMWRKTAEAAAAGGRTVYRYSQTPWLWSDQSVPQTLKLKLEGAAPELANAANAFVMGVDDTGAFGAGRAAQEKMEPTSQLTQPRLGLNEAAPQSSADVNAWTAQEYPLAHGAGQALGMLAPWGAANRLWEGVQGGGKWLVEAAAKTRLGGLATRLPGAAKGAAGIAGDAATGGVAAAGAQVAQEGVDAASRGELPDLAEAGERVAGAGESGLALGAGGSALGRLAHAGAEGIRDSSRFSDTSGPGLVRRTEPNVDWRIGRAPRLNEKTDAVLKQAAREGVPPGDILAEQIAPKVRDAAQANTKTARDTALAERRNYQSTPEGATPQRVSHLERMSLEKLRDHHQPQPDGTLRPVDNKFREAQQVFNRHIENVSLDPVEGAIELSAQEAGAFLGPRARYRLLQDDIEAAAKSRGAPPERIERDAYLRTIKDARARAAADDEIEAGIEDIVGDRTPTPAARERAEQRVLRELVDEASFVEANGELAEYLKQRGKSTVYVKPAALDARRTDTLVGGLKDPDLVEAAKYDRQQFRKGGERGGYELMRRRQGEAISKAEGVEKSVAPGGDAFGPVAGLYQSRPGEKQLVDQVRALADQAGVREQLDRLRGLQSAQALQNRARFRGPSGENRGLFNPQNQADVLQLRAFPALRALEGPLGPLRGGNAGRAALLGNAEDEAAQVAGEASPRSRYEAARARRLKEVEEEKAARAKERDRRKNEPIRRRR